MTGPTRSCRWMQQGAALAATVLGVWLNGLAGWGVPYAQGACVMEHERADQPAVFVRHLGPECTEQEREAQAIRADDVLAALREGKGVDVAGAMVVGDLFFDALPPVKVEAMPELPAVVRDTLRSRQVAEVRRFGPVTITRSVLRGAIGARLKNSAIIAQGPVILTGTTFERTADFSYTVFLGQVSGSEAVFLAPALFVHARFTQPVRFEKTAFGPHTRFHRSVFSESVSFLRAGFNGLSEFLEVTFDKEASFSRAYFKMGTGFSGSRFAGIPDFSEAVFEREAFFAFTIFEQDAYFRRATFRGTADFSDAYFKGVDDFSKVMFDVQPNFSRVKVNETRRLPGGLQDPRIMYAIAAVLAVFTLLLLWNMRKP